MNLFERWDKIIEGGLQRLVQSSLGAGPCAEFLESYARALEDIETRVQSMKGRRIFPYKRIALTFLLTDPGQIQLLAPILAQKRQLSNEVRRRLDEAGCETPATLRVDATAIVPTDPNQAAKQYEISYDPELPPQSPVFIRILIGDAGQPTYRFAEQTVNIGRCAEVHDDANRLIRRNHVVFLDRDNGPNSTVSREHAHISFDTETGWYRLYDDSSRFGSQIYRRGQMIEVPQGPTGGAWLRPGDEVHLGKARLEIDFNES
jgi:pSer/pThr/pTyr-binding forkhead associated (FHA) protein